MRMRWRGYKSMKHSFMYAVFGGIVGIFGALVSLALQSGFLFLVSTVGVFFGTLFLMSKAEYEERRAEQNYEDRRMVERELDIRRRWRAEEYR